VQYFSLALRGMPYMGVGRNLMYNRSLFERAGGFRAHEHIASGDDDLFVNATATRENTRVVLDENSFVYSLPEKSWRGYYNQKKRHLSTARSYRLLHKTVLGALSGSHFLHYAAAAWLLAAGVLAPVVVCSVVLRWALITARWNDILRRLHQRDLLPWVILMDVMYLGFYTVLAPALFAGKRNRWK
jgi:poly-beta-1,6-N-acetyl-D-glucosamine synthase